MKSKDKRKSRRQAQFQEVVEQSEVTSEEIEVVEKVQRITHPCPVCGLSEMRRVVGGGEICPLCDAERRKSNVTAKAGSGKQRSNVLVDYFAWHVRRWIHC